jgi:carboxypeptidase PM20D1
VADGSIWGRGAIDDKSGAVGLLDAAEALLANGFVPARTIYFAFGHNEEGGGDPSGARAIAAVLAARGVRQAWLMDEGGLIYDRVPGVSHRVAFVGIAEKAPMNVELVVTAPGGHAAMPPSETAVGILARALDRVERQPMPARIDGAARGMFDVLAPEMTWPLRTAFANSWLVQPLVIRRLAASSDTNAIIRTTMAPTILEGSPKDNVLASRARAVLNVRLLPGDTPADVESHLRRVIGDARVQITLPASRPVPGSTSAIDTPEFTALARAIRSVYPEVFVAPYLTIAATDSREYAAVAANLYRFLPIQQDGALEMIHGRDEHVRVDAYANAIRIYATLITELAGR